MTTKILGSQITPFTIETTQLSNTAVAAFAVSLAPKVLYANVANSAFTVLDDTAVNVGGGYIVVTGSEFQSGATVLIDTTPASAVTFVNSTTLRVQVPTKAAASYNLYVVNPDGGVGVKVSGLTYSTDPTWVTSSPLDNQAANTSFNVTLSATGATSYSVAAGSTLPAGTSLAANGYFYGTVSIGAQTTYTFSVVATDAELQDSSKTFQVTVTVIPQIRLYSWGRDSSGSLGLNTVDNTRSSPTQIGTGTNWSSTGSGCGESKTVIKNDGTLWVWGGNNFGQLGQNDIANRSSPVQVGSGTNWSKVSNGTGFIFMAVKTDGTLWCWGRDFRGSLGLTNSVNISKSSPVQIGSGTTWSNVFLGFNRTFAIKTDGTLWTWGYANQHGEAGLNNILSYGQGISSPTQVGSSTTWAAATAGEECSYGIKTDGTLWAWGRNNNGESGLNESIMRSSPVQVGSGTNWSSILELQDGGRLSGAIKTDGTLWTWGANDNGQLGHNDRVTKSSPTQVAGATWLKVAISYKNSLFGIKTNGTLWSWGQNQHGQLGQNDAVLRSSPVQIGSGTTWTNVFGGNSTVLAQTSN